MSRRPGELRTEDDFNHENIERMMQHYDTEIDSLKSEIEALKTRLDTLEQAGS